MAATGGGKIRSRRYHIASKPYAKGKQQPVGLISRVTDTVKSIVPSWLQRYFKNGEIGLDTAATAARLSPDLDGEGPPPNGNDEGTSLPDGRDSPEPSTSNTEPSTSRSSTTFQDVLSRPPLNRSHLHFASLDGPSGLGGSGSLFPQPSTSTAAPFGGPFASPFAGASTSNFSLVKEIKDSSSQHEDDNISTTSGFSSRASDKDMPTSKPAPLLWSPETERTHSGPQPSQTGLKKPAFNLSVFGNSALQSTMNSSMVNSSQLGDSPYYPGKTTYGGAAASSRSSNSARSRPSTPYQVPMKRQIKAKPAGAQPCGVTSATARRILLSLERMSSPLADAKRIPSTMSSPLSSPLDRTDLDGSPFQVKKKKLEPSLPPVQKLVVPSAASVSGNRSIAFRPSLTPGGVNRTLDRTAPRDPPVRRSPLIPETTPAMSQSTSPAYPLSSTPAASTAGSGGGKMKRERSSVRPSSKRPADDEAAEVPDLPAISLPISTRALPTFSFTSPSSTPQPALVPAPAVVTSTPAPTLAPSTASAQTPESKAPPPTSPPSFPFTFSSPIVKATPASPPSFSPSSGFTFSAPVMKTGPSVSNELASASPITLAVKKSTVEMETKEEFEGPFKPAKTLKQGSVLDILKAPGFGSSSVSTPSPQTAAALPLTGFGDKFKPSVGSWSCDTCMVQNTAKDTKCVACQSPKPQTDNVSPFSLSTPQLDSKTPAVSTASSSSSLGLAAFAPPAGTWECDTCLVQNKPEALKCVACETAKPGTGVKPGLTLPTLSKSSISTPFSSSSTASGLDDAPVMISTSSAGSLGFGDKFKKPEGSWECDTCMVQNKAQDTKCVACQSAKPGKSGAMSTSLPPLSSSSASAAPLLGFGDKFKKPAGSWECEVCCVSNKADDMQCVACQSNKPGAKTEPKAAFGSTPSVSSTGGFKFGASTGLSSSSGIKFGGSLSETSSTPSGGFKFGTSTSDAAGGFKFGGASSDSSSGGFKFGSNSATATPIEASSSSTNSSSGGFKFGTSTSSSSTTATSTSTDNSKTDASSLGGGFKFGGSNAAFGTTSATLAADSTATSTATASTAAAVQAATTTFSFGLTKTEEKPAASLNFKLSDASATPTISSISAFGKIPAAEPATSTPSLLSSAKFGEPESTEPTPVVAPVFSFGQPVDKKEPASAASSTTSSSTSVTSGFLFGAGKETGNLPATTAPSAGFSFSKPEAVVEPKAAFAFGKTTENTEADVPKPTFTFGKKSTDAPVAKPAFGFVAAASSSTPASSTPPAPSLFGAAASSTTPAPAPTSTFLFGQSTATAAAASDGAPPKGFMFGQSAPESAAPTPAQPFIFGAAGSTATPTAPSFAFGGSTPAVASSTSATAAPAPFAFSATSSTTSFGSSQSSIFGQGASQPAPSAFGTTPASFSAGPQAPAFGANSTPAPVFGQSASTTPAFGASNSTTGQSGGFQFGGANAFGSSSAASNVFTFGGASSPAPPAVPQPAAPAAAAGFGFGSTPTFNIGSNKSSTATPAQHGIAGRKIKTAVRRRK